MKKSSWDVPLPRYMYIFNVSPKCEPWEIDAFIDYSVDVSDMLYQISARPF